MLKSNYKKLKQQIGFTLLEILIALFIFTILSMIFANVLHNVINVQSGTERTAEEIRKLQMAMLIMSRDIEQTVDRPVLNTAGKEEAAFIGTPRSFTLTHAGFANPTGTLARSTLQRTNYSWNEGSLLRGTWTALDQAPQSQPHTRKLLTNVADVRFEYLDQGGKFHAGWPLEGQSKESLPRAVRIVLTISSWGKLSQLYVISAEPNKAPSTPPKS